LKVHLRQSPERLAIGSWPEAVQIKIAYCGTLAVIIKLIRSITCSWLELKTPKYLVL
jgi:hypothetical protein